MTTIRGLAGRFRGLTLRAGADAAGRAVRWVHVSELPDPTPWLRGGELVLTAGVHLPDEAAQFRAYALRLAEFGVAGLGFGIAPIHQRVPPALVTACDEAGLPLLEVPASVKFIAISEAIAGELEADHLAELRRLSQAQRALVSAAAELRPASAVVRRLASQLRAGVVLAGPDRQWSAGTPLPDTDAVAGVLSRLRDGPDEVGTVLHARGAYVVVEPVPDAAARSVLVIARATMLSAAERSIVRVATSALSLAATGVPRESGLLLGAAVAQALSGAPTAAREAPVARALGVRRGTRWRVAACATPPGRKSRTARERWRAGISVALNTPLLAEDGDCVIAVMPDTARATRLVADLAGAGEVIALSGPRPWAAIAESARDARRAMNVARITGQPGLAATEARLSLSEAVNDRAARAFAESLLDPLCASRPASAATLLLTLRTWLCHHGSWDATAAALGVHRNTVRNRIALVARSLECDLDDADVRMQLWFALRWSGWEPADPPPRA